MPISSVAYITQANTSYIVAAVAIANGTQTIANQPDYPRNVTIAVTDANSSITAGTVTVTGTNTSAQTITETLTLPTLTKTGTNIFKTITSVVVANLSGATAADTLVVGIGENVQLTTAPTTLQAVIVGDTTT